MGMENWLATVVDLNPGEVDATIIVLSAEFVG
jgi:hypothetical protein